MELMSELAQARRYEQYSHESPSGLPTTIVDISPLIAQRLYDSVGLNLSPIDGWTIANHTVPLVVKCMKPTTILPPSATKK
jgi:hypothetical protein